MNDRHDATRRTYSEHWTDSGKVLVLDGSPLTIREIAVGLSIPLSRIIRLTAERALLALWEDSIERYLGTTPPGQLNGNRNVLTLRACHYLPTKRRNKMRHHRKP
jgi:hypothetical protein